MILNNPNSNFKGKPVLSRRSRQRERLNAMGLSVYLSVFLLDRLLPKCKNAIFSQTKQFTAMVFY